MVHNSDKTLLYGIIALLAYRGVPPPRGGPQAENDENSEKSRKSAVFKNT